jgi:hypothetical protein
MKVMRITMWKIAKISIIGSIAIFIYLFNSSYVGASVIAPSIVDTFVVQGETFEGEISYTNTSDKTLEITPVIYAYNSLETHVVEDEEVFVTTTVKSVQIDKGETTKIKYSGAIAHNTPIGTYFNVIAFLEKEPYSVNSSEMANFDILKGEGALIALHVLDQTNEMNPSQLTVSLKPEREWFVPKFLPTITTLTITNSSPYVINVLGEARILTEDGKIVDTIRLQLDETRLYPDQSIEKEIVINPLSLKDANIAYSFTSNMTTHSFSGELSLPNYAIATIWSLTITFVAILVGFILAWRSKKKLGR